MNSGNPLHDATDHFNQIEWEERHRITKPHLCTFCNREFYEGLEFEFEKGCDECIKDGTARRYFAELEMPSGLIERIIESGVKLSKD